MKKNKSFTLIELLVAIAIIGLLSSIVLVSTKGARDKARIAKALEFSQSVYHSLGANTVGIWRFEEGLGNTAYDSSGYGNNGTINGASYTIGILGTALSFDGADDYVDAGNGASLTLGSAVTAEAWVYAKSLSGHASFQYRIVNKFNYPTKGWYLFYNSGGGRFTFNTYDGIQHSTVSSIKPSLNTWYHIVGVSDGTNNVIYVNGVSGSAVSSGTLTNSTAFLQVGGYGNADFAWEGLIDEVRIYTQALSTSEIQKHYAEGLEKHDNLVMN